MEELPQPRARMPVGEIRDVEDIIQNHDPNYQPFPGIILRNDGEQDYYIMSPTNSDDGIPENVVAEEVQAMLNQNIREFVRGNRIRMAQHEANRERQPWELNIRPVEVNNNGEFRNYNGYLSPSPSPQRSPIRIDEDHDDAWMYEPMPVPLIDPVMDELNLALNAMQPNQSRPRKRRNSDSAENGKRKRVTFKEEDEIPNMLDDDLPSFNDDVNAQFRRQDDDDDEGFFGGPPAQFAA